MSSTIAEALAPLRARMPQVIREEEVLRVAAAFPPESPSETITEARRIILAWAQRRAGGRLPPEAWAGSGFEYLSGGRTTIAVNLFADAVQIWALRADDPDKKVAGRTWTTEVTIGQETEGNARLSVRLLASSPEDVLDIEPHAPGFIQQLTSSCGLRAEGFPLRSGPWHIVEEDDLARLIELLEDPARILPVFVASGDERGENPDQPLIDASQLSRAMIGLAHVVVLPAMRTYGLSDAFGKLRSVYHGAVRVFMPGFGADVSPYDHQLFLYETLRLPEGAARCVRSLRLLGARESLVRRRLNHDVLTFASVRSATLRSERMRRALEGASESVLLKAAQDQVRALDEELTKATGWEDQLTLLYDEAEARAIAAESQLRASVARIQQLESSLRNRGGSLDAELTLPENWAGFLDWCDQNLVGRLVLAPAARRAVRKAEFQDVSLAARCLIWLANECRDRRMDGGGSLADCTIENGVRNSACGGDEFELDFQGQRLAADWHVKNGGNTREPTRCLRIYYGWDAQAQLIVVADMPAHRRTGAT